MDPKLVRKDRGTREVEIGITDYDEQLNSRMVGQRHAYAKGRPEMVAQIVAVLRQMMSPYIMDPSRRPPSVEVVRVACPPAFHTRQ